MYVAADAEWKVSDHHGWDEGAFVVEPLIFEVENHQRRTVRGQCWRSLWPEGSIEFLQDIYNLSETLPTREYYGSEQAILAPVAHLICCRLVF